MFEAEWYEWIIISVAVGFLIFSAVIDSKGD